MGALERVQGVGQLEFTEFYRAERDKCLRAVLAVVGDRQLAEDLVSEAFTRSWVSWQSVRRHPAPSAWVVRTALNTRISWWRRRRREVELGDAHEVVDTSLGGPVDPTLLAILRRLPRRQREVIVFRVFLDLDTEATARELGMARGTVTAHLARAVATLRGQLVTMNREGGA